MSACVSEHEGADEILHFERTGIQAHNLISDILTYLEAPMTRHRHLFRMLCA